MTYATLGQLTDQYGAHMLVLLTDRGDVATGEIDAEVVARALEDADALIDGFLKDRYALPLAEIPVLLSKIARRIAIWELHRQKPDEKIETDYKDALATLDRIGSGKIRLSIAGVEPEGVKATGVRVSDRVRPLTVDNLKGFV